MQLGKLDPGIQIRRPVAIADGNHGCDPRLAGARDDFQAIGVKLLAIEMCVRIDKHGNGLLASGSGLPHQAVGLRTIQRRRSLKARARRQFYFNRAPTGTSSRKLANTGWPPSSDAATIIPLDSSPRIFRGARFATITTL